MIPVFSVDPDITVASTIDSAFYCDAATYALARERIFARTWQWIGDLADVGESWSLSPRELLPGLLDEPLLLSRDGAGTLRCLSNVCTHRGNILVRAPCTQIEQIRCGYHSRRFDLSGRMTLMPEFADARNFPSAADDLAQIPFAAWANHGFVALDPVAPLEAFLDSVMTRLAWLPVDRFYPDPAHSRDYTINAHWALYVENYLEGFHIPFVHAALNRVVDYGSYADELFRYATLQIALAKDGEAAFDLPASAPDHGRRVAAYYAWIFPNLMLTFIPGDCRSTAWCRRRSTARASSSARMWGTKQSSGRAPAGRCTRSSWKTKRSSKPCSAACARGFTAKAAIRRRASAAHIISTACCASSCRPQ